MIKLKLFNQSETTHKTLKEAFQAGYKILTAHFNKTGALSASCLYGTTITLPSGKMLSFVDVHDIAEPLQWIP